MKKIFIITLLVFIGLGLPDSIFTSTWPDIATQLSLKLSYVSFYTLLVFFATFISTLSYPYMLRYLGFSKVVSGSLFLTFIGMALIFLFPSAYFIAASLFVAGMGAGCIDSAINDYASNNFSLSQINILHGFWGIGVSTSSLIVTIVFSVGFGFRVAFLIVAGLLFAIFIIFILNANKFTYSIANTPEKSAQPLTKKDLFGVLIFWFYAIEFFIGIYLTSYLKDTFNFTDNIVALLLSMYWIGITISRISMPITTKVIDERIIIVLSTSIAFIASLFLRFPSPIILAIILFIIGCGFGPIYPTLIHFTSKVSFGNSDKIISYQIAAWSLSVLLAQVVYGLITIKFGFISFSYITSSIIFIILILIIIYLKIHRDKLYQK